MFKIFCLGNAIVDIQLQVSEEEFGKFGLKKSTMNLVDASEQNSLLEALREHKPNMASGGSAANTAITVAELGSKTAYCCSVGEDELGSFYIKELKELGVETFSTGQAAEPTGTSVILITPDAERTMNTSLGASARFDSSCLNKEAIKSSEWVYIEGYLLSGEASFRAAKEACEIAKASGVKVALTLSDVFIVDVFRERATELIGYSDLVFANINEASAYTRAGDEAAVLDAAGNMAGQVAVTLSERGSYVYEMGKSTFVEPVATTAVDSTGAGDAYAGGVLHGLCAGISLVDAASLGSALASKVVSKVGPRLRPGEVKSIAESLS